jgi:cellulose synthase operon protein C
MKTAAPVASMSLIAILGAAIVWQAINLWRPHHFAMPPAAGDQSASNETPSAPVPETQPSSSAKPGATAVDETALRYFAHQGDTRRLNAEIARLRSLYSDWTPPEDPLKGPTVADPQLDHLWSLYAQGQFAEVRAAIAERQGTDPKWLPPKDLTDQLDLADARSRLVNASNAKQYETVIQIASSTPNLRTCGDVDVLWRTADAFAATDRKSRAADAYRYILTNCPDKKERAATMQKAAVVLPRSDLEELLTLARKGPDGDDLQTLHEYVARGAVAETGSQPNAKANADDIALLEKAAEQGSTALDPLLLGWYWLRHGDAAKAQHWFQTSYARENAAESAEGLGLALIQLKKPAEAEAALAQWRDENDAGGKAYLSAAAGLLSEQPPLPIAPDVLARIVDAVVKRRDPATAQLLGWYAHAFRQDDTAARWFAAALAWKPDDEPSAYGLAVTDLSLNRRPALLALERIWKSRSLRIAALTDPAAARALAAGSPPTQAPAAARTDTTQQPATAVLPGTAPGSAAPNEPQSAVGAQSAKAPADFVAIAEPATASEAKTQGLPRGGWRLLQLNRPAEAAAAFSGSLAQASSKGRGDAAYGLALADLQLGLLGEADNAAQLATPSGGRSQQLRTSILREKILQAYAAGRYRDTINGLDTMSAVAPESVDLMTVRGWSYFHLQRYEEAQRVFEALSAAGHEGATRALYIVKQTSSPWYMIGEQGGR